MNLEQQLQTLLLEPPTLGQPNKSNQEPIAEQPCQRRFHSAVIHKSSLYIYGGIVNERNREAQNEQSIVYRYNYMSKIWTKIQTHFLNNISFSHIYAHSVTVYNNMMYLFGGRNYTNGSYIGGLWCLNLESYNWKRQELKCYSPVPREFANFVLHQRSSLVLYGGRHEKQNLNDFHIYRIQNKIWQQVQENSYDLKISCRLRPALCSHGDHLFLFGGERMRITEEGTKNELLKDFYQIKVVQKPMSSKPDLWVKNIITNSSPSERVATFVNIAERYLVLWGGRNKNDFNNTKQSGFWLYSIADINWTWVNLKQPIQNFPVFGFSVNYISEKCIIFGQHQQNPKQKQHKIVTGMTIVNFDLKEIEAKINQSFVKSKSLGIQNTQCWQCNQQEKCLAKHKFGQFALVRDMLVNNIPLVYSAFGLLLDNSSMLGAKQVRIIFNNTFKQKYCLIQDNGSTHKMWPNSQQFVNDMLAMRTYIEQNIDQLEEQPQEEENSAKKNMTQSLNPIHHPASILNKETKQLKEQKERDAKDKEMEKELKKKKRIAKQMAKKKKEERIQYCRNLKIGALRIGDKVISITRYGSSYDNRRVFVIQKSSTSDNQIIYQSYYYVYENGVIVDPSMDPAKRYIDQEYKAYLKIVNDHKEHANNFVFITSLRQIVNQKGQLQPQLKQSTKHSDVFCCEKKIVENLQDNLLWDSLDLSLKNYLSMLYLKNDDLKISLSISQHRNIEINNSDFFEKIDHLVKTDRLVDLMPALDLQNCSIIEAYYNRTSNRVREFGRKTATFHFVNGVLFYRKNRLICRYKYPFGQANSLHGYKVKQIQQALMMFGFIEIQPQFSVNIFKTAFIRDDLLEDINLRLKFVQKYAEQKLRKEGKEEPTSRRPGQERLQSRKRFKGNDDQKFKQNIIE